MWYSRVHRILLILLILSISLVVLVGCAEEEGKQAREIVDETGQNALKFADGFCGAIILVPLFVGITAAIPGRRKR